MKTIALTQGAVALVDDDDYEELSKSRWCLSNCYAMRSVVTKEGPRKIYMHQFLAKAEEGEVVLHRDGNKVNNQRSNLAVVSRRARQQRTKVRSSSGYKGVGRRGAKWVSHIGYQGKTVSLGTFSAIEDAARAYDKAALEYYGPEALLNFPRKDGVEGHRMTQEVDNVG